MTTPFEILESEVKYRGRAFDVRRDHVRLPDGNSTYLDIVEHVGAVTVVPVGQSREIWFVRQYRHAAGQFLLELPAGTLHPGEDAQTCAQREVREEIGMSAAQYQALGTFYLAPGYSTELMQVYLATELSPDPLEGDPDEFLSVETVSIEQAFQFARQGVIRDAKSLAALFLAERDLRAQAS